MSEPHPDALPLRGPDTPVVPPTPAPAARAPAPGPIPAPAPPAANQLTPEEQMALFEKELKETDWGHQPC